MCWFEPMLQGSPAPLVRFSNVLYVPQLASNLSLFTLTALGYTFTGTGTSLAFSKDGQVLFQASVRTSHWSVPRSHPTCSACTTGCPCSCCCTPHTPAMA